MFLIFCVMKWEVNTKLFCCPPKYDALVFELQAELAAVFTERDIYLKKRTANPWLFRLGYLPFSFSKVKEGSQSLHGEKTANIHCQC